MSYISQSLESDPHAQSKGNSSVVIEVSDPQTHGIGNKRYTDYLVKTSTNLPVFKSRELSVRRRFSDFESLRSKIENDLKIKPPALPDKAWKRQIPFLMKETLFDDEFIEERRKSLESFINKISEHPLVQTEKMWISFLQDDEFRK